MKEKIQQERALEALTAMMNNQGMDATSGYCFDWAKRNQIEHIERGRFTDSGLVGRYYFVPYWLAIIWRSFDMALLNGRVVTFQERLATAIRARDDEKFRRKISAAYRLSGAEAVIDIVQGRDRG